MRIAMWLGGTLFVLGWCGCAGLTAATEGVGKVGETAGKAKGEADKGKEEAAKGKGGDKKGGGGGEEEDDDGNRLVAKDAQINTPIDDKVNFKKGDKADWRKVQLAGRAGIATFEVHWDEEASNIDIDVFDKFGTNIGKSPPKLEGQQVKKVLVQIDELGQYYFRISAPSAKDGSIYTAQVKWKGPAVPLPPPAAAKAEDKPGTSPPPPPPGPPGPPAPPPPPTALAQDPTKLLANIVTAYKEGSTWVWYIDKGASARVRVGMSGQVLEGPEGDKPLDGATFSITQVIDDNKAIARSTFAKPLGKNKRVVMNLK
jgi:hypothetical protein